MRVPAPELGGWEDASPARATAVFAAETFITTYWAPQAGSDGRSVPCFPLRLTSPREGSCFTVMHSMDSLLQGSGRVMAKWVLVQCPRGQRPGDQPLWELVHLSQLEITPGYGNTKPAAEITWVWGDSPLSLGRQAAKTKQSLKVLLLLSIILLQIQCWK